MLNYFRSSISRKIVSTFSLFLLLLTVVIMIYYPAVQQKQIRKSLDRYIVAVAEVLAFTSGSAMGDELNINALGEIFNWAKQDKSMRYLAIVEKDGNILAAYNPQNLKTDYNKMAKNREVLEDKENDILLTSTQIKHQEENLGRILLGYSLDETKNEIAYSRSISLLLTLPLCLLGIGMIMFISNTVTRPIKELSDISTKIANEMGDISNRVKTGKLEGGVSKEIDKVGNIVEIGNNDEVGKLANSFNIMTNSIFKATTELDKKNDELETTLKQLKEVQQQLIEKEKLASLAGLTAGIAHEIRNPLNFVNNFSEVDIELLDELREELEKYEEKIEGDDFDNMDDIISTLEKNAKKISEHGKRADGIIKTMLQHSRGQAGEIQTTKFNEFIKEYVSLAYHGIRAKDASISVNFDTDYDDSIGEINLIPQNLSRVILNIVNNACYAINSRKKEEGDSFFPLIHITSKNLGDCVEVKIKDNGNGIPQDVISKIFNPFFTTKPTGEGTGLGLSMSYDIVVQEHRGQIKVESKEGSHTEFIITLPKSLKAGVII